MIHVMQTMTMTTLVSIFVFFRELHISQAKKREDELLSSIEQTQKNYTALKIQLSQERSKNIEVEELLKTTKQEGEQVLKELNKVKRAKSVLQRELLRLQTEVGVVESIVKKRRSVSPIARPVEPRLSVNEDDSNTQKIPPHSREHTTKKVDQKVCQLRFSSARRPLTFATLQTINIFPDKDCDDYVTATNNSHDLIDNPTNTPRFGNIDLRSSSSRKSNSIDYLSRFENLRAAFLKQNKALHILREEVVQLLDQQRNNTREVEFNKVFAKEKVRLGSKEEMATDADPNTKGVKQKMKEVNVEKNKVKSEEIKNKSALEEAQNFLRTNKLLRHICSTGGM